MNHRIKFLNSNQTNFHHVLRQRVDEYFLSSNISSHANALMVFKTIFMLALYFVPFALIVSAVATGFLFWLCWFVMGWGLAGIGMSVMHDANHKAYSSSNRINTIIGYSLNLVGGDARNWKLQHNILHHTFTNIHPADEDVSDKPGLRFSPNSSHKSAHRYQFIYAFFLYSLLTFFWVILKDLFQVFRYQRLGVTKENSGEFRMTLLKLILWKIGYLAYTIIWPVMVLDVPVWHVLLGFVLMHLVAGLILSLVFQLAHVVDTAEFPVTNANGDIENEWAIHQLTTTANFSGKNKLLTFYLGGLNYQIEHHLFPKICHVHYPQIAPIVADTAKEFGLPYVQFPAFSTALASHIRLLKKLGRKEYQHMVMSMMG
jgi:linoleoyl-CoA desaturase